MVTGARRISPGPHLFTVASAYLSRTPRSNFTAVACRRYCPIQGGRLGLCEASALSFRRRRAASSGSSSAVDISAFLHDHQQPSRRLIRSCPFAAKEKWTTSALEEWTTRRTMLARAKRVIAPVRSPLWASSRRVCVCGMPESPIPCRCRHLEGAERVKGGVAAERSEGTLDSREHSNILEHRGMGRSVSGEHTRVFSRER